MAMEKGVGTLASPRNMLEHDQPLLVMCQLARCMIVEKRRGKATTVDW